MHGRTSHIWCAECEQFRILPLVNSMCRVSGLSVCGGPGPGLLQHGPDDKLDIRVSVGNAL